MDHASFFSEATLIEIGVYQPLMYQVEACVAELSTSQTPDLEVCGILSVDKRLEYLRNILGFKALMYLS